MSTPGVLCAAQAHAHPETLGVRKGAGATEAASGAAGLVGEKKAGKSLDRPAGLLSLRQRPLL